MITTINPYTLEEIESFPFMDKNEVQDIIQKSSKAFSNWRKIEFSKRAELLLSIADLLRKKKKIYAKKMTEEMGKPISQAIAEVEKCAWVCEYYAEHGEEFLKHEIIESDATESMVRYEPIGVVLAIMPWNFPFWQVFRFFAPAVMAGNVALVKHAPNSMRSAMYIQEVIEEAGFPEGIYQNVIVDIAQVPAIIEHPVVKAITLTGSERAGSSVASQAGKSLKKTVLELGGSNAFIVLEDADIEKAVDVGVFARMQNNGQSCIAAKRFFIHENIHDEYIEKYKKKLKSYSLMNPLQEESNLGPLARVDLAEKLEKQVKDSINQGAKLIIGGHRKDAYFEPTILTEIKKGMPAFDDELFGPVAAFARIKNLQEAISLSNESDYGLGVSIFTSNPQNVINHIDDFEDGAVFINELVKSDPRLPFGGTKNSGYGRELGPHGIKEFVNIKTVYIA